LKLELVKIVPIILECVVVLILGSNPGNIGEAPINGLMIATAVVDIIYSIVVIVKWQQRPKVLEGENVVTIDVEGKGIGTSKEIIDVQKPT